MVGSRRERTDLNDVQTMVIRLSYNGKVWVEASGGGTQGVAYTNSTYKFDPT